MDEHVTCHPTDQQQVSEILAEWRKDRLNTVDKAVEEMRRNFEVLLSQLRLDAEDEKVRPVQTGFSKHLSS